VSPPVSGGPSGPARVPVLDHRSAGEIQGGGKYPETHTQRSSHGNSIWILPSFCNISTIVFMNLQ